MAKVCQRGCPVGLVLLLDVDGLVVDLGGRGAGALDRVVLHRAVGGGASEDDLETFSDSKSRICIFKLKRSLSKL